MTVQTCHTSSQVVASSSNAPVDSSHPKTKAQKLMSRTHRSSYGPSNPMSHARIDRLLATQFVQLILRRRALQAATQNARGTSTEHIYKPRMDLYDDPANPHITALLELPGMKQEDVTIHVDGTQLFVEGERPAPSLPSSSPHTATSTSTTTISRPISATRSTARPAHLHPSASTITTPTPAHVRELRYGHFRRAIAVPAGLCPGDVRATLSEGMLTLEWPRALAGGGEDGMDRGCGGVGSGQDRIG